MGSSPRRGHRSAASPSKATGVKAAPSTTQSSERSLRPTARAGAGDAALIRAKVEERRLPSIAVLVSLCDWACRCTVDDGVALVDGDRPARRHDSHTEHDESDVRDSHAMIGWQDTPRAAGGRGCRFPAAGRLC
jgi:hypothetical protein